MEEYLHRINNPRPFVGHHKEQQIFWEELKSHKDSDHHSVLLYDGIPGIGKSGLLNLLSKDLQHVADDKDSYENYVSATIDFADERYATDWLAGLEELRYQFARKPNHKVGFDTYDIAYFIYLKRTNPRIKLETKHSRLLENSDILIALIQFAESYETGELSEYWEVTKLLTMVAKFIDQKALPELSQWWKTRGNEELALLRNIEKPHAMADLLPHFFAQDIKNYLRREKEEGHNTQTVIFLDTYEKLRSDEWIHKLVKQLPEVFWVFASQKQLDWEKKYASQNWNKNICQCTVDGLLESEASSFLEQCNITNKAIVERILSIYQGIPYYLNLLVDFYQRADNPTIEDFPKQHEEIHNLFIRNLSEGERSTFYMLSCLLSWNSQLLLKLLQRFSVGESIQKIHQVVPSFSFVILRVDNEYVMHEVMRNELYDKFKSDNSFFVNEIHQFCYNYFQELCADHTEIELLKQHITSAVYHGSMFLPSNKIYEWIREQRKSLDLDVDYAFFVPILEEIRQRFGESEDLLLLADCLEWLGAMYFEQGRNDLAENCLRDSLDIYQNHSEVDKSGISVTKLNLFSAKAAQFKFNEESEVLLEDILGDVNEADDLIQKLHRLNTCANYLSLAGRYSEAERIYRDALQTAQQVPDDTYIKSGLLNDFGLFLINKGNFEEGLLRLIQALGTKVSNPEIGEIHPVTSATYNNIGLMFLELRQFQYADLLFGKAASILEELLMTEYPGYAKTQFNLGRSCVLQYETKKESHLIERAEDILNHALSIQESLPNTGVDIALTLSVLGHLFYLKGNYGRATVFCRRSLTVRSERLPKEHPELLNSLINMSDMLVMQNKPIAARPLLQQALEIRLIFPPTINSISKEMIAQRIKGLRLQNSSIRVNRLTTGRRGAQVTYVEDENEKYCCEVDYYVENPETTYVTKIENLSDFTVAISLDNISTTVKSKASTYVFNGLPVGSEWIACTDTPILEPEKYIKIRVSFARIKK